MATPKTCLENIVIDALMYYSCFDQNNMRILLISDFDAVKDLIVREIIEAEDYYDYSLQ